MLVQCKKETVPAVTITDNNFLNALIEQGVDKNDDGIISTAEADLVHFLDVSYRNISDLKGIEAFINLDSLFCTYNLLTSLDVSYNTALIWFECHGNLLTSLDVSNNAALVYLYCTYMPSLSKVCV